MMTESRVLELKPAGKDGQVSGSGWDVPMRP